MSEPVKVNRGLCGILALGCLVGFVIASIAERDGATLWQSGFLRIGLMLGTLWMALPKSGELGSWANVSMTTLIAGVAAMFIVARNPRQWIPIVIAVIAMGRYLRPRDKPRPPRAA